AAPECLGEGRVDLAHRDADQRIALVLGARKGRRGKRRGQRAARLFRFFLVRLIGVGKELIVVRLGKAATEAALTVVLQTVERAIVLLLAVAVAVLRAGAVRRRLLVGQFGSVGRRGDVFRLGKEGDFTDRWVAEIGIARDVFTDKVCRAKGSRLG